MPDLLANIPELLCYREYPQPPALVPGRSERDWMEASTQRFAYRCTPLGIANASGWELLMPCAISASWNGGNLPTDVRITSLDGDPRHAQVVAPVFGHGVLTFHPGYLFRTSPGWALCARAPPNTVKDGITGLEGLVETDWLPFTFTMNWRFTRPGSVRFDKDEPFCFISMVPHGILDQIEPKMADLAEAPKLNAAYDAWREARNAFHARLARREPEALKLGWQRDYISGRDPSGQFESLFHRSKRKLKEPT
ncbi:MAG: hypothetical protein KGQ37_11760 [Hyphomicrobiales bacterium]|nr:hypothetical protein [Hyphomicrobiales bacterium]